MGEIPGRPACPYAIPSCNSSEMVLSTLSSKDQVLDTSTINQDRKACTKSMKCEPPSLLTTLGTPKEVLQPIWSCSPLPQECTRTTLTLGRDPWSRLPTHRIFPLEDCSLVALRLGNWYSHAFDILGNSTQILLRLHTCLARRIHFAKLLHGFGKLCSILHRVRSDNAQEFCGSHTSGYRGEVDHSRRLWIDMSHPIGEIGWGVSISSYLLLEVCTQSPWSSPDLHTWTGCSNLQKSIISQILIDR